jgi:hypothetical protein
MEARAICWAIRLASARAILLNEIGSSMVPLIECAGDPRAMGQTQGLACRSAVQERVLRAGGRIGRSRLPSLNSLASGPVLGRGLGREVIRHYTHLAERMAGIARNADVSFATLMKLFCRGTTAAAPIDELMGSAVAVGVSRSAGEGPLVLRTLTGGSRAGSQWIVRKSRPEVGFASAEVTLPWLASAVAGINEAGVSVAIAPRYESHAEGSDSGWSNPRHAPHALLLVQECLQRFEDVGACLDWCSKRPCSGDVSLVLADAAGCLRQVDFSGGEIRVVEPKAGLVLGGASPNAEQELRVRYEADSACLEAGSSALPHLSIRLEAELRRLSLQSHAADGEPKTELVIDLLG